ncbi:MAG: hypothetical protein K5790_03675 [Nitrosopumilus sp.]|uniref:hypothetical protein n=1 Tax=Nitrosopumilus sp. TaxID=2024843 RepID=UPI00247D72ED|nr:hypothetical protein [Nitrosopumilus sp.]MCV0392379.1 hypothetical protein [Nitrosopumilus sp.]
MTQTKNIDVLDKINQKYFLELETSVPHIQQTLFDLQNEWYKAWKNTINASLSMQKEFQENSGYDFKIPDTAKSILENLSEEALKYRTTVNKITITTIEASKNNAKVINDNADMFIELNRKIMHYWLSVFSPK